MIKTLGIILTLTLGLSFPLEAQALDWSKKEAGPNHLNIQGKCQRQDVNIYLYPRGSDQPIYNQGVLCLDGKFSLQVDLTQFNIPDTTYQVTVAEGSDRPDFSQVDLVDVNKSILSISPNTPTSSSASSADPNQEFNQATKGFSSNLEEVNKSLIQMKKSLPGTNFADPVKAVASALLSAFEDALLKINQGFESLVGLFTDQVPTSLKNPYEGSFKVSSYFGEKRDNKEIEENEQKLGLKGHDGVDFAMPSGTSILAVDDGQMVPAEGETYGTTLVIKHAWGKSFYGHLSSTLVKEGNQVKKGQKIALSGNSGLSTGAHLHFGIKLNHFKEDNGYLGKIDPLPYLQLNSTQSPTPAISQIPSSSPVTAPSASTSATLQKSIVINQNELGFLRVRSEASVSADEVGQVKPGQTFVVLSENNGWVKIEFTGNKTGWVSTSYVTVSQ